MAPVTTAAADMVPSRPPRASDLRERVVWLVRASGWGLGLLVSVSMLNTNWGGDGPTTFGWHPV